MKLTPKQEAFCREYMVDRNATQAAIRAGYGKKNARMQGAENLAKPHIIERIGLKEAEIAERNDITIDRLVQELKALALADITQLADTLNGSTFLIKSLEDIPLPLRIAIESIQQTKDGLRIKLYSKTTALDMLLKHLGGYEKDNQQRQPNIPDKVFLLPQFQGEEGAPADGDGSSKK